MLISLLLLSLSLDSEDILSNFKSPDSQFKSDELESLLESLIGIYFYLILF